MQMVAVESGMEEVGIGDDSMAMKRLRELGLDLVEARQDQVMEEGQGLVMLRMTCQLEGWVRDHLDSRAEREGGLTQDNVARVAASTTHQSGLGRDRGMHDRDRAASLPPLPHPRQNPPSHPR